MCAILDGGKCERHNSIRNISRDIKVLKRSFDGGTTKTVRSGTRNYIPISARPGLSVQTGDDNTSLRSHERQLGQCAVITVANVCGTKPIKAATEDNVENRNRNTLCASDWSNVNSP